MNIIKYVAVSVFFAASLAAPVFAQTTPNLPYTGCLGGPTAWGCNPPPSTACPQLSYNLYRGLYDYSTRGQVSQLQQFLSTRGYYQPVTGYFGAITYANVAQFQREQSVYPITGGVGPLTRAAIQRVCGYGGGGGGYGAPSITGVSGPTQLSVGQAGTWQLSVSDQSGSLSYSVVWGDEQYYAYPLNAPAAVSAGYSGSLSHTYSTAGTYTPRFTVTNAYGQSANASASVVVGGSGCIGYSCNTAPTITSITPTQGPTGTVVYIYGSGFTSSNVVHFGQGGKMQAPSFNNGTLIYYTIPQSVSVCDTILTLVVCGAPTQLVVPGAYSVYVNNSNGQSASQTFTVTSGNCLYPYNNCQTGVSAPSISYISTTPACNPGGACPFLAVVNTGAVGSTATVHGSGFTATNNTINFGAGAIQNISSSDGATLTFTVPSAVGAACNPGTACPMYAIFITPGTYNVSVTNANGTSNTVSFTVTGASVSGAISVYPQSGYAPLTVTFTLNSNSGLYAVDFGDGTSAYLQSGSVTHTYYSRGTYTAQFTSDMQCLHSNPMCMIGVQNIGSATVTVY